MWIIPNTLTRSMSLHSAPAEPASTSASSWQFQLLERSCGRSGKVSPARNWYAAWKRTSWIQLLVGRICEPSTVVPGMELWTSCARATRANRTATPADAVDRQIIATCGHRSLALSKSATLGPFSARTSPGIFLAASRKWFADWSAWTTALRAASLRRRKLARPTPENESSSSLWPTARAGMADNGSDSGSTTRQMEGANLGLKDAAELWPTIKAADDLHGTANSRGSKGDETIASAADLWQTPASPDGGSVSRGHDRIDEPLLAGQAEKWATPCATDGIRQEITPEAMATALKRKRGAPKQLTHDVANWATPAARDFKGEDLASRSGGASLSHQAETGQLSHSSPLGLATIAAGTNFSAMPDSSLRLYRKRRLNPIFVCLLMGWPLTALGICDCSATGASRFRLLWPSCICGPHCATTWERRMRLALSAYFQDA